MKIRLVMLGKTRREETRALLDDYIARIRRYAEIGVSEIREATHYKIGRAAEVLGISRKTLLEKRKKYGLL